jgi:hypothetical protein
MVSLSVALPEFHFMFVLSVFFGSEVNHDPITECNELIVHRFYFCHRVAALNLTLQICLDIVFIHYILYYSTTTIPPES